MNKNIVSTCAFLAVSAAFCPFVLSAMPTRAELKEAQPIVSELMAGDVAALKAGKTDAKAVAEKALGYVDEASSDAAKFLLLQGAFYNYTNARDYDKAAETVDRLREVIPDMEPAALAKMIAKALRKGRAAGRLSEMQEELEREIRYARLMVDVDAELKSKPKDEKLLQMSAEYHALTGDWKDALPKFENLGGKFADVVAFEKGKASKLTATEVGDFWWGYPVAGESEEEMNGFKRHAYRFYKEALAAEEVDGLRRQVVKSRASQLETYMSPKCRAGLEMKLKNGISKFRLKGNLKLDMVPINPGSFMMGNPRCDKSKKDCSEFQHQVTLTYQFYMARTPTTVAQWEGLMGEIVDLLPENKALGPDAVVQRTVEEIEQFCAKLNERFAMRLPKGLRFRLPTEAEWEYAFTAGGKTKDSHYDLWIYSMDNTFGEYRCLMGDVEARLKAKGFSLEAVWESLKRTGAQLPFMAAKILPPGVYTLSLNRKANEFGLCDYGGQEICLDSLPYPWFNAMVHQTFKNAWEKTVLYDLEETDPYRKSNHPLFTNNVVYAPNFPTTSERKVGADKKKRIGFRLALGPDLKPTMVGR